VNQKHFGAVFITVCLAACAPGGDEPQNTAGQIADIVFLGPNIVTVDESIPDADAVAVRGDEILAVGSRSDILSLSGDDTRIVELGDHALIPGFIDAHGHMSFVGRLIDFVNLSSPPVGTVQSMDDLVGLIVDHIERTGASSGEWVIGYGYDDSLIAENRHPTRDDLDRASTEHPIVLMHVSGHLVAVNSAALAAQGVDADSEDPPGGVIRRRPGTREPNGVMEETATGAFRLSRPGDDDPAKIERMFRQSADVHASYGITTVQDGGAGLGDIEVFRAAAERQPFPVDIVAFASANRLDDATLDAVRIDKEYAGGFRVGGVKFMLDGSPQGRTAFLSRPYDEGPPGAAEDYVAYPSYPAEEYNTRVTRMIRAGKPVLAHANGDAAIDMMIAGVAAAVDVDPHPLVIVAPPQIG